MIFIILLLLYKMTQQGNIPQFKIVMLGDGGVGKTTYIKRHITGEFENRYLATMGVEVSSLKFSTQKGQLQFNIWDLSGQEKYGGLFENNCKDSYLAMVMFDVTSHITFENVTGWINEYNKVCPNRPIILLGNKVDVKDRKVSTKEIQKFLDEMAKKGINIPYFDISAKSNYNFEKPFLLAARKITNQRDLEFVVPSEELI